MQVDDAVVVAAFICSMGTGMLCPCYCIAAVATYVCSMCATAAATGYICSMDTAAAVAAYV